MMELSENDCITHHTIVALSMRSINVFVNLFPDIIEMTDLQNMKLNIKLEAEFKRYFRENHKNIYRDKYNTSLNVENSEI